LVLIVVLLLAGAATAQVSKNFNLYAGGGITFPTTLSGLNENWKDGYHIMGGVGFSVLPKVQGLVKLEFHQLNLDWEELNYTDVSGNAFQSLLMGVEGRAGIGVPAVRLRPYVIAGFGIAKISYSEVEVPSGVAIPTLPTPAGFFDNKSEFYYNLGVGVNYKMMPMLNVFIQLQTVRISTEGKTSSLFPLTVGVKL
jgi:opacity protein-like surface antigen